MFLALFLGVINLFKLWLVRFLPLLGDEAYYNLWSKHLALSYTDHPPVIAYLHWIINFIFGQNEFGVRLGAILCLLISSWLIYLIGKEAFGFLVNDKIFRDLPGILETPKGNDLKEDKMNLKTLRSLIRPKS